MAARRIGASQRHCLVIKSLTTVLYGYAQQAFRDLLCGNPNGTDCQSLKPQQALRNVAVKTSGLIFQIGIKPQQSVVDCIAHEFAEHYMQTWSISVQIALLAYFFYQIGYQINTFQFS